MISDTLDDWAVCQLLITDAVAEIELGRDPLDDSREPWGGLFKPELRRVRYGVDQLISDSTPGKSN